MQAVVEVEKESPATFAFRKLSQEIKEVLTDEQENQTQTKRNAQ